MRKPKAPVGPSHQPSTQTAVNPVKMTTPTRRALAMILCAGLLAVGACKPKPDPAPAKETQPAMGVTPIPDGLPAPQPVKMAQGTPEVVSLGSYEGVKAMRVGALTVLHKPVPANQIVSAQLYFLGGSQRLGAKSAGVERLALDVATRGGTESTDKDAFHARLDAVGASITSFNDRDASGVAMKTIVPHFGEVWELFTQAVLQPAMPEDEMERARKRQLAQIEAIHESADAQVSHITTQAFFKGHPYAHIQLGTRQAVEALTREDLLGWQRMLLQPENMLLVVVGDVPEAELIAKVQQSFGRLEPTGSRLPELPELQANEREVVFERKDQPTNYVFGLFRAPAPGHPDYPAMLVAMDYLGDRLFEEVRTKRNLTYAVSAGLSSRKSNYGYLYTTAVDPETTLGVILDEVERLKAQKLPAEALAQTLNVYLTHHYMGQETNGSQASSLATAYIVTGDWRASVQLLEQLRAVTPERVQEVANTYIKGYTFGVVGPDESKIPRELMMK